MSRFSIVATTALAASVVSAGFALADPPVGQYRTLSGVGSDTTEEVMNAVANSITAGGGSVGSYNATGSATINTKAAAACQNITRPNGSGAGRAALVDALTAGGTINTTDGAAFNGSNACLEWARSSSLNLAAVTPKLAYVPFAKEAVSYAVTSAGGIDRNLSLAELQDIYKCVGNMSAPYFITPMLPQAGSGTRSYWLGQMGITEAQITAGNYPCILNGTKNGNLIQEHSGLLVDDISLVPYSAAQYGAQQTGLITDKRGQTILGNIGGTQASLIPNPSSALTRELYNVIPDAQKNTVPWSTVFKGTGSLVCTNTNIAKYMLITIGNCGDTTTNVTP